MGKISAVIITFNEEKNIRRCILSLQPVVEEILVVDSYSTDNTVAICQEMGVQVIQHPFEGHIQQKNFGVSQATYDYILSLDADEALSDRLGQSILSAKQNLVADAYAFNRLTNYCGKWIYHCGWYPDRKLRLWKKQTGSWGGTNPHDKVIMAQGQKPIHLTGDLLHYSFYTLDQHIEQINYFSSISAEAAFREGKRSNLLKILYKPLAKFLKGYVLKAGFLDGYYGWIICVNSAHAKFLKYTKLYELQRQA